MQSHISTCIKESFCLSSLLTYANIFQVKLGAAATSNSKVHGGK